MQYCKCTNDFVNAIIDDYFNSFKIRKDLTEGLVYEWTNSMEQIHDRYSDEEIITPTEPTWTAILIHAWENSKWNTCPTMADTPLLHSWTAPGQMTYVSNWLWDTVWRTTPLRELTPIRLKKNFLQKWTRYKRVNQDWLLDTLMMLFLIDITPIFSLSHLEKQRMETLQKIIQNQKKRVYTTCISLVYHVYITTSK